MNLLKHRKVKAEQEQNKKLQNQIREMEKKIQDLGEEHKKEISKIKKVCSLGDSNLGSQMCILGTLVRNIKIKFGMGNKDEITGRRIREKNNRNQRKSLGPGELHEFSLAYEYRVLIG